MASPLQAAASSWSCVRGGARPACQGCAQPQEVKKRYKLILKNIIPKMRKSFRSVRNQTTSGLKYCRNPRQKSLSMNSATKLLNWDGRDVASMFLSLQKMPFEYLVQHQSANYRLNFIEQFSSCDPRGRRTSESVLGVWVPDTRTLPIIVLTRTARHSRGRGSPPLKQSFCRRRQRQRHVRASPLHVSHFSRGEPALS